MAKAGITSRLYVNAGSYASPDWEEVALAADVTLNLDKTMANATTRGGGGWKNEVGVLKGASVEFDALWKNGDVALDDLLDSYINGTAIEIAIADGPIATAGTEYWRMTCEVSAWNKSDPIEDLQKVSITAVPTIAENAPSFHTVSA